MFTTKQQVSQEDQARQNRENNILCKLVVTPMLVVDAVEFLWVFKKGTSKQDIRDHILEKTLVLKDQIEDDLVKALNVAARCGFLVREPSDCYALTSQYIVLETRTAMGMLRTAWDAYQQKYTRERKNDSLITAERKNDISVDDLSNDCYPLRPQFASEIRTALRIPRTMWGTFQQSAIKDGSLITAKRKNDISVSDLRDTKKPKQTVENTKRAGSVDGGCSTVEQSPKRRKVSNRSISLPSGNRKRQGAKSPSPIQPKKEKRSSNDDGRREASPDTKEVSPERANIENTHGSHSTATNKFSANRMQLFQKTSAISFSVVLSGAVQNAIKKKPTKNSNGSAERKHGIKNVFPSLDTSKILKNERRSFEKVAEAICTLVIDRNMLKYTLANIFKQLVSDVTPSHAPGKLCAKIHNKRTDSSDDESSA